MQDRPKTPGSLLLLLLLLLVTACSSSHTQRAAILPSSAGSVVAGRPLELETRRFVVDRTRSRFDIFGSDIFGARHRLRFERWEASLVLGPDRRIEARIDTASVVVDLAGATGVVRREVLEVDRFPRASLDAALTPASKAPDAFVVEGVAELHGVKRTLRFDGRLTSEGEGYRFATDFILSRKEFAIRYAPMEPFLADDVRIVVVAHLVPEGLLRDAPSPGAE